MWETEGTSSVSLKHMAGDGMVQHVELAFPRHEVCSEPRGFWAWGLTFKQGNPICLQ